MGEWPFWCTRLDCALLSPFRMSLAAVALVLWAFLRFLLLPQALAAGPVLVFVGCRKVEHILVFGGAMASSRALARDFLTKPGPPVATNSLEARIFFVV